MKSKITEWKQIDNIGIITINNPPKNLLDEPDFLDIDELKKWADNDFLKGLIIIGNGRHFSYGANIDVLPDLVKNKTVFEEKIKKGSEILRYIENLNIPTIASIKGACFGGGLEITLSCHIRICSENGFIGLTESSLGLMPGLNGTIRLPKLIGTGNSLKMIMAGDILNAEESLNIGIVDYIVPNEKLFDFSFDLMKKMTDNRNIEVIRSIVTSINNSKRMSFEQAMEEEMKMFCKLAVEEGKRARDK